MVSNNVPKIVGLIIVLFRESNLHTSQLVLFRLCLCSDRAWYFALLLSFGHKFPLFQHFLKHFHHVHVHRCLCHDRSFLVFTLNHAVPENAIRAFNLFNRQPTFVQVDNTKHWNHYTSYFYPLLPIRPLSIAFWGTMLQRYITQTTS
ncbi:hypothetical protein AC1031_017294 [Aphanomyces cochlioides]|nr:hypothetical protein AC1031_017294 [Aphanomyces cochlioides]